MFITEVAQDIWLEDGHQICGEDGCGVHDGTVYPCEHCGKPVCVEHDDVLENRGIDSGLVLCIPCGDEYDKEHYIAYTDDGDFAIGPTFAALLAAGYDDPA